VNGWLTGLGVVVSLELRQRVRSVAWYVLLGISVVIVGLVTVLLAIIFGSAAEDSGGGVFSGVLYLVLLLGTLVAPAVSGTAINGDRDAGTLATTQVTQVTASQIVLGKFVAAWATALAFLIAASPFLLVAALLGGVTATQVLVSVPVIALELGVVAAIGVGLSGLLQRSLFSIVVTYLAVAALTVGTLVAFGLGSALFRSEVTVTTRDVVYGNDPDDPEAFECGAQSTYTYEAPRTDYVWWLLAANPYVVVADAVPPQYDDRDQVEDFFGFVQVAVRAAQQAPELEQVNDYCDSASAYEEPPTSRETIDGSTPSWFVGLAIHLALAAAALAGATWALRTPLRRLSPGSRIA